MQFIIEPEIRRYCGPLFFSHSLETAKGNINANGTFALVDTGKRKLLITCYHVLEDFQKLRKEHPELQFCVCLDLEAPIVFDTSQVIDYNQKADLVTFDIGPLENACRVRKFYRLDHSPSPLLKKGDQIVFVGYPGRFRFAEELEIEFGRILYGLTVADVSGRTILANVSKTKATFSREPRTTPSVQQHGGISGSPCFLLRFNRPLQLAAFVTDDGLGLLRLSHARCINADGTVNPPYP
jgi:hypothetical protein